MDFFGICKMTNNFCYNCMMLQVKKLQQQLQEEIDLRLALASAVEHSDSNFSSSPAHLPDKVGSPYLTSLGLSYSSYISLAHEM